MTTERPESTAEACPPWCVEDHALHDLPDDRRHQSEPRWMPVTTLRRRFLPGGELRRDAISEETCILAVRYLADRETWVAIATETRQIELTPESAARLHAELGALLARLAP
ncbi:hypothetical protein JVX92_14080 [Microbacterium hominis]|uniref:DUF6907 domain-containing protein n=1 Tax=Microbacterium hominis TaxID=162426 RepID=UPI0019627CD7|nr:hypothetical protein [Microbacterium hominis]QRY40585.1 hypothetical protein JVX92_14080 [Microbacterium hominis]